MTLTLWAVFDHPAYYPEGFVAREYEVRPGDYRPTGNIAQAAELESLRNVLRNERGKQVVHRFKKVNSTMLEVWM